MSGKYRISRAGSLFEKKKKEEKKSVIFDLTVEQGRE